jgi:hypothetical protein
MHLHFKHQIARVPSAVRIWLNSLATSASFPAQRGICFAKQKKRPDLSGLSFSNILNALTAGHARGPVLNRSLVEGFVWSFHATAPRGPGVARLRCRGECFPPAVAPEHGPGDLASPAAAVRTAGSAAEPGFC